MRISSEQLSQQLARELKPLYTVFGDEPLLAFEAGDRVRARARADGYDEREVLTAESGFKWPQLTMAANAQSLFASRKLLELRIPGGKPGIEGGAAVQAFCAALPADTVTLVTLPSLDWRTQKTAWFEALDHAGVLVEAKNVPRKALPQWLATRLQAQGQDADAEALAFIAERLGLETNGARLGLRHGVAGLGVSTVNLGLLAGTGDDVRAHLNIRAPQGLDLATQRTRLASALAPYGGELKIVEGKEALWVAPDAPLVRLLLGVYRQFTGDNSPPLAIGGTTYAKAFPGFVAFGMGFPGSENLAHAENERLKVDDLRRGMAIYLAALAQLAGGVTLEPAEPAALRSDGATP